MRFFLRILFPISLVGFLSLFCVSILARQPEFQGHPRIPVPMVRSSFIVSGPPWQATYLHYRQWVEYLTQIPEVCWTGNTVSDFQHQQCDDFWNRLLWSSGLSLAPILICLIFVFIFFDLLRVYYRKGRRKTEIGKALFSGMVTQPPLAPNDFFGWLFCLRKISIQLGNGKQVAVYMPLEAPIPLPGEVLAVFDWGTLLGAKRIFGILHAPHMAVLSGE